MFLLFTDFGWQGPYLGELEAVLYRHAPQTPSVRLQSDAPTFRPQASSYLLERLRGRFHPADVVLGVVDPGVGGARRPLIAAVDGYWLVGPDNGLFARILAEATTVRTWVPDPVSANVAPTFHGRDVFAPLAARLANHDRSPLKAEVDPATCVGWDWPDALPEVIYCDGYGNAMTGLRADRVPRDAMIEAAGQHLQRADYFDEVPVGDAFWYSNSLGLIELAVNQGRAVTRLGLDVGTAVRVVTPEGGLA